MSTEHALTFPIPQSYAFRAIYAINKLFGWMDGWMERWTRANLNAPSPFKWGIKQQPISFVRDTWLYLSTHLD